MAKITQLHPVHLSILCFSSLFVVTLATNKTGFSLELIPLKSDPTHYKSNLTDSEFNLTAGSLPISLVPYQKYLVPLIIGTGLSRQTYNLALDTGNRLTWTQCQPCRQCFQQSVPIFEPRLSSTFHPINCADQLCRPPFFYCLNNQCVYRHTAITGIYYHGYFAKESITVRNSQPLPSVAIGCTFDSRVDFVSNQIHGLMGLDLSPTSFLMQARPLTQGAFSYCLVPQSSAAGLPSFLRFGTDIIHPGIYQTTSILRYLSNLYYISVIDININDHRMGFGPGTFDIKPNGNGGVRIDMGFPTGRMIPSAHARIANYLRGYFQSHHVPIVIHPDRRLSPCIRAIQGIVNILPTMTLHLPNRVNFDIHPLQLFISSATDRNILCFTFRPDPEQTVIGSYEQHSKWMKFDTDRNLLSFATQYCTSQS